MLPGQVFVPIHHPDQPINRLLPMVKRLLSPGGGVIVSGITNDRRDALVPFRAGEQVSWRVVSLANARPR